MSIHIDCWSDWQNKSTIIGGWLTARTMYMYVIILDYIRPFTSAFVRVTLRLVIMHSGWPTNAFPFESILYDCGIVKGKSRTDIKWRHSFCQTNVCKVLVIFCTAKHLLNLQYFFLCRFTEIAHTSAQLVKYFWLPNIKYCIVPQEEVSYIIFEATYLYIVIMCWPDYYLLWRKT